MRANISHTRAEDSVKGGNELAVTDGEHARKYDYLVMYVERARAINENRTDIFRLGTRRIRKRIIFYGFVVVP